MPAGRPRIHDRQKIAQDLVEWAAKDDSININKFTSYYDPPFSTTKLWVWAEEDPEFRNSYETAKQRVATRREEWLNDKRLHVKAFDISQYAYDPFLHKDRADFAAFMAALKVEEQKQISTEDKSRFDDFIKTFKALQKQDS